MGIPRVYMDIRLYVSIGLAVKFLVNDLPLLILHKHILVSYHLELFARFLDFFFGGLRAGISKVKAKRDFNRSLSCCI
ncbi:hypothetical protein Psal071_02159 [Piscirickettsia salmonis]|uniref:Uncharacterized protein n=1 Tax=Piscirickettsia salmonis TaxID=1238 RepID=A0A9Q6PXB9_PISSA|nr:Arginine utilization regulatory protein RocR [Piscirickettsia salmonis]QGN94557.1 hypothetical protein Psal006a_01151 [Piscirickettsia salmonis]QGO06493.1 hypothetical protein Psal009_02408 [Piscirickettsia salmonis]QGO34819.1 hypothetical protein Psal028_02159 [Piscirickettsia salmonis]QGO38436.1 hypothetical protein Psal040_02165 [Piscirickettsia salmonis]